MRKRTRDVLKEFFNLKDSSKIFLFFIFGFAFLSKYFSLGFYKSQFLMIKIGYPIFVIFSAYVMSCIGAFGWKYFERETLKKKIEEKKMIDIRIKKREKNTLIVTFIAIIFFLVTGIITNFNLLYTLLAIIVGGFVGRIIIKKLRKRK